MVESDSSITKSEQQQTLSHFTVQVPQLAEVLQILQWIYFFYQVTDQPKIDKSQQKQRSQPQTPPARWLSRPLGYEIQVLLPDSHSVNLHGCQEGNKDKNVRDKGVLYSFRGLLLLVH